ncbi:MAG: hypothetical protein Q9202_003960 [Teloschistes flavicans]
MSLGFSLSDIKLLYEFGYFIYDKAFSKAQGAHIQYFDFGRDIQALAETLQRLAQIIQDADKQKLRKPWQTPDDDYRGALQPVTEAAGDFRTTLNDCQTLLDNNRRFRRNASNFVDNVQWTVGVERDVNILRDRVRFHLIKLGIMLKPFEIILLLEIRGELRHVRGVVTEIRDILLAQNGLPSSTQEVLLPPIPHEIATRFARALSVCPPPGYTESSLPLQETADALIYHFSRSTVEYNPGLDLNQRVPKVPQYLNLLKSRWIFEKLECSSELRAKGSYSFWAGYLAEIRSEIVEQYQRFANGALEAPPEEVVLLLSDSCFSLWLSQPASIEPARLSEPGPTEEKILELDLPDSSNTRQSSLTVFKRSAIEFRLVTTVVDKHNKDFLHEKEIVVNTNASAIVPAYGVSSDRSANPNSMLISNHHVNDLNWQLLRSSDDISLFQEVLLGYRVSHTMSNIRWSINGSSKPGQSGHAQMQTWQFMTSKESTFKEWDPSLYPVTSAATMPPAQPPGHGPSTFANQRRMTALSGTTILSAPTMTTRVSGSRGVGTVLLPPNPPVFVLLTMLEGKYTFLHFELDDNVMIDRKQCDCRSGKKPCAITIITGTKGWKVRKYSAGEVGDQQGLATWDLAVFRHPEHPKFKTMEVLSKVKYLRLSFASPALNEEFQKELKDLEGVRIQDLRAYNEALDKRRNRDRGVG